MGRRDDNFIDDDQVDHAVRRMLERRSDPIQLAPPPDLVTRTLRRLPPVPPAAAAQAERWQRVQRRALGGLAGFMALMVAALSVWNVAGNGPELALVFGDGSGGISKLLLTLHLAVKPLWNTLAAAGMLAFALAGVAVVGGGWLWWWLIRRAPLDARAESFP